MMRYFKKYYKTAVVILICIILMTGCANDGNASKITGGQNSVDKVLNDQTTKQAGDSEKGEYELETEQNSSYIVEANISEEENNITKENNASFGSTERVATQEISSGDVDIDLTEMGSDMVYATVYQLMVNPGEYIGKTIKMEGTYYASYFDQTEQYYHYCIIQDALQCCSQGMEFIWEDGSHVYPDDYPEDGTLIVVTGTFATYREEGSDSLYCCLRDSEMVIV